MIILDTNVLSELLRPSPAPQVETWLSALDGTQVYFTAIGEAELRHGLALMPTSKRRAALAEAIDGMLNEDFHGRILPFDRTAARAYASIAADRRAAGRPISQFDCQICAIASANEAAIATRNTGDFQGCGVVVINPWDQDASP